MNILKLENVVKIYGRGGNATKALDGVSLDVAEGEFVTIMGASGSGKTTLLNLIASIDSVTGGTICVEKRKAGGNRRARGRYTEKVRHRGAER